MSQFNVFWSGREDIENIEIDVSLNLALAKFTYITRCIPKCNIENSSMVQWLALEPGGGGVPSQILSPIFRIG